MKFIVKKGTQLFDQFVALKNKIKEVELASDKFISEEVGNVQYCRERHVLAGGISAVEFKTAPDKEVWKKIKGQHNLYFPRAKSKELLSRLDLLPVVKNEELNNLIKYQSGIVPGTLTWSYHPGVYWGSEFILLEIHEGWADKYSPVDGMEEITTSMYAELKSKLKPADDE